MLLTKKDKNGMIFTLVTLGWTWGILAIPVFLQLDFHHPLTTVAYGLAGASPSLWGLFFVFFKGQKGMGNRFCVGSFLSVR